MAESRTNGTGAGKTEWYAGASRFELELEVCRAVIYPEALPGRH